MKRLFACLSLLLLLTACESSVVATVTRFNALAGVPAGRTFFVQADQSQAGGLEFQHYAALVGSALQANGFTPAGDTSRADLVAMLRYGNAGSQTTVYYDTDPWCGPGGGWGRPHWQGGCSPFPPPPTSYTTYAQYLEVTLLDGPDFRAGRQRALFQGRAITATDIRDVSQAMPYLVQGLFYGFPGNSGQTVRVVMPVKP